MKAPSTSARLRLVAGRGDTRPVVLHVAADDSELVELSSVVGALERSQQVRQLVVHAHRATTPSDDQERQLPTVDVHLELSDGSHASVTAAALAAFEQLMADHRPDVVLLAGDGDACLGAGLAAAKLGVAVSRLRAGLRSWDWTQAREINRVLLDHLSDTLFTHSPEARDNLLGEGIPEGRVHAIGSTRIDVLRRLESRAAQRHTWAAHRLRRGEYVLVILDQSSEGAPERVPATADALIALAGTAPTLAVLQTTAWAAFDAAGAIERMTDAGLTCLPSASHLDVLSLQSGAGAIVTDADWVQEEASALGVACFSLMTTTPVPVTLTHGTNMLLGPDPMELAVVRPTGWRPTPAAIPLWDGRAGERAAETLLANYTLAGPDAWPVSRTRTLTTPSEEQR